MIDEALGRHLVAQHNMSHRDYEVLVRLDGAGGRMRMSQLAAQIVASAPLITQTVHRLEQRGWVARERASLDGRGVEAVLLPDGRRVLAAASGEHADLVQELLLSRIGEDDLGQFAEAIGRVADHMRSHRSGQYDDPGCTLP